MSLIFQGSCGQIYEGDSREVLKSIPSESVHALGTDPPGGAKVLSLDFDDPSTYGYDQADSHHDRTQFVRLMEEVFSECLRILLPGAYGFVWTFPRTSHWTRWALENVGFQIVNDIVHIYSTGMPRSHNVQKATGGVVAGGTGLKPCQESWVVVRKPLKESTIAKQALATSTGYLRIDDCRIPHKNAADFTKHKDTVDKVRARGGMRGNSWKNSSDLSGVSEVTEAGRWPGNLLLSGCAPSDPCGSSYCPVCDLGESAKYFKTFMNIPKPSASDKNAGLGLARLVECRTCGVVDVARFCDHEVSYTPLENDHPTPKPLELVRYLVRLFTPVNGVILDPFLGSGTLVAAAIAEDVRFIGVEKDQKYALMSKARALGLSPEAVW